ncbi:hypothetical protein VFPPC_17555 [Pochonia chlamydosporia 170]|uniref:Uncharacterized protein n=1 Tax=Pochonia chlamydosporia 170 TaxID=1380566 RepID=A0A219ARN6_METCM|nr:hypothetical protein VFPPC_17555 [Pochonia chlamydosporia 170]OWT43282.1 hypothetical protein VFPPC_17555 [Pochonia chlamydosporia 170]
MAYPLTRENSKHDSPNPLREHTATYYKVEIIPLTCVFVQLQREETALEKDPPRHLNCFASNNSRLLHPSTVARLQHHHIFSPWLDDEMDPKHTTLGGALGRKNLLLLGAQRNNENRRC